MKTKYFPLFILLCISILSCKNGITLKSGLTEITIDGNGFYSSVEVDGKELLGGSGYPIVSAVSDGELLLPVKAEQIENQIVVTMSDGNTIKINHDESNVCITYKIAEIPESYKALVYGPIELKINEVVGDVIGVVQGDGVAFGMQALNIKTMAGIPLECRDIYAQHFVYQGVESATSTATTDGYDLAAANTGSSSVLQLSCRRRNETEYREVNGVKRSLTLPVDGDDAFIKGSKVALFGCKQQDALENIGKIEVEQGLPHPMFDGEWGKTNRDCQCSYMITNFSEETLDFVISKAKIAGFKYIYEMDAFDTWGHFKWSKDFVDGDDEAVARIVQRAESQGIHVGIHSLSNFITTNDAYISPIPSKHLQKQALLMMTDDIDESQTEIEIDTNFIDCFNKPLKLYALQIDNEIVRYGKLEENNARHILTGCERGAFGTTASSHKKGEIYKLWDHPYATFFPDITLQDSLCDRLVELFNATGLRQLSFDGLEGCTYTGQDEYATTRFVTRWYSELNNPVINDASRLNHYLWHIHSRMNWGEPWGEEMREGQVQSRIKNQDFFKRNLFPRMLGWFQIRLHDKKLACTSLEDLEWALSEAAGFDAGCSMTLSQNTLREHGQIDMLLSTINDWDRLRMNKAFSEAQMERLKDPATEWHLEKIDSTHFKLHELCISKKYHCNLSELQPGQPAGSDWTFESEFGGQVALKLFVDGEGSIENPTFVLGNETVMFPCIVKANQYLTYGFDGTAYVTDCNYNVVEEVNPIGKIVAKKGTCNVSFSCEKAGNDAPTVVVRFMTKDECTDIQLFER